MDNILDLYQKQVQHDRIDETYDYKGMAKMSNDEYEEYKKTVDNIREQLYVDIPNEMASRVENKSYPKNVLEPKGQTEQPQKEENTVLNDEELNIEEERFMFATGNSVIKRAYCPFCGEEIITQNPTMYNPFNFEPVCVYKCPKCEHEYKTNGSYPRLCIKDPKNNSTTLHVI